MQPPTVLAVLAELAPAGGDRILDVTRGGQPLAWLAEAERAPRGAETDRLAALSTLHREERILRRGWGFLAGRIEVDGKPRKVRVPLLSQPVHLERALTGYRIVPAGDLEITPLIADRELAAAMEAAPGLAAPGWLAAIGTRAWLWAAAEATGLPVDAVTAETRRLPTDRLVLVAGAGLFVVRDVFGAGLGDSLRSWAGRDLSGTALAAVYGEERTEEADDSPVLSPLPLTGPQERVVVRARTAPVTVVSGPPGNGKSHTVVAAALEVVHRGGSVLVATQSPHAAEVLADLLGRYPGPEPVLFGDAGSRETIAADLAAGAEQGAGDRELRAHRTAVRQAHDLVRAQRAAITELLDRERLAASLPAWQPLLPGLAADVPGAFDDKVDLARASAEGWWARWWFRRRLRVRSGVPEERVTEAIAAATAQRAAGRLATGGTDLAAHWAALHAAESGLATAVGTAMRRAARSAHRWDREARRGAAALSAALRAGRNRRRELLAHLDAPPLVRALPLWIGTVADVEDLLPAAPGLFDLVVIDEASHVDQVRAAPVLARARRALVVGDPRQLRFVSFVSDVDVAAVLARHGADERLDVRRMSTYDLAAGAAPVTWLADHHRSAPHLIGFSARRFYQDRLTVLTRTPDAEATDAIDVIRVPPAPPDRDAAATPAPEAGGAGALSGRDGAAASVPGVAVASARLVRGVNAAEVAVVLEVVAGLAAAGRRGIGVISPFRAQAEAIEEALVAAYPVERIEELGLRTGTVHAFQGSEAEVVVVSLALVPGDAAGRRRFVADPHLFNVMITRARTRLVLVTSLDQADGLLGDYLAYAAGPPPPAETLPATGWAAELGAELTRLGVPVRPGYPVGEWRVDLCAGPVGVICGVHPDGPEAHLARQRALHRLGWRLVDAFPSRWREDPRRAALEVAAVVREGGHAASPSSSAPRRAAGDGPHPSG